MGVTDVDEDRKRSGLPAISVKCGTSSIALIDVPSLCQQYYKMDFIPNFERARLSMT